MISRVVLPTGVCAVHTLLCIAAFRAGFHSAAIGGALFLLFPLVSPRRL